ncbi:unnamed protein product, partial [Ectocarpus sp. 6 AP-2014]
GGLADVGVAGEEEDHGRGRRQRVKRERSSSSGGGVSRDGRGGCAGWDRAVVRQRGRGGEAFQLRIAMGRIPVLPRPPAEADVMISRLPNILGVKTEAFDPDTYEEEAEADEFKFTTNIIRWRHKRGNLGRPELGDDGRALRESNTRLVKQERARAEEAMHKQARRKNKDYSKYSNEDGSSGRRPAMNIEYLEARPKNQGAFDDSKPKDMRDDVRAGRYDDLGSSEMDDDESEDQERGLDAFRAEKAAKAAAKARANQVLGTDSEEEEEEEDEDEARGGSAGKGKAATSRGRGSGTRMYDDEEEEEEEDSDDGRDVRKRPAASQGSTPGRGGKRLHRSITEDSSESE